MARIFVSYRRQDSGGRAGRIYDRLRSFFGPGRVFMDVEGIDLGADFTEVLDERIADAEVVIAVIGPHWISASTADGQPRLFGDADYVRYELTTAMARGIAVIPVLVDGAEAPSAEQLPEDLADLADLQMYVISDVAMDAGMARLIHGVERAAARTREARRLSAKPRPRFHDRWWARLLLLYEPTHPAMWLLHLPFFVLLVLSVFAPVAMWRLGGGEAGATIVLLVWYSMTIWLVLLRGIVLALEPDPTLAPLRRKFLLYSPPRALMGIVHLVFLLMVLLCLIAPLALADQIRAAGNDLTRAIFVQIGILILVLTFVVREIGASGDPLRSVLTKPNGFARLFCIWTPQRAVAWLPRIVYYAAFFLTFLFVPRLLLNPDGDFGLANWQQRDRLLLVLALLAAITVAARGAAGASEVAWPGARGGSPIERIRWILLLYVPWKRAGYAASALFFLGLGLLVALTASRVGGVKLLGIEPAHQPVFGVLAALLALCAWTWAQLYRPPAHWRE